MTDIIFYFGEIIIIAAFVTISFLKFKEEYVINLQKHKWIILLYLGLMILAIITWRIIYLLLTSSAQHMIDYNNLIQRDING